MSNSMDKKPTIESYNELQDAYDFLNAKLFNNKLPSCLITYQRTKNAYGYHSGNRWTSRDGTRTDEIAMNPSYFATRTIKETLSTLAHEMCHLWQHHFGKPGRGRYHNKEWVAKMKNIGLQPFNIHNKKRETGDSVSHLITNNGKFGKIYDQMEDNNFTISWLDRNIQVDAIKRKTSDNEEIKKVLEMLITKSSNTTKRIEKSGGVRIKYSCPNNHYSVWGKKNIDPICGQCDEYLQEQ